jgi:hypothetical protein
MYEKCSFGRGGDAIRSTFLIATVTLTVTLVRFSTPETKKPQHMLGFQRSYMAVG